MSTKTNTNTNSIVTEFMVPGALVLIRTVTMIQTGRVVACDGTWVRLADACWIADTGRWSDAVRTGLEHGQGEIEPFSGDILVSLAAVVDICTLPSIPTKRR